MSEKGRKKKYIEQTSKRPHSMKTKSHGIQFHANNVRIEWPTFQFELNLH